jgi:peptidoglycan/xylan/chitin deacetylase (PgdA/CDA1 family)
VSDLPRHARGAGERYRPLVLGYHRVVDDFTVASRSEMPSMLIGRAMFERHIDWLGRAFRFVTLDEIGACLESGGLFSEPVAAITFDDGYRDVYENALPVLRRKGIPAAIFVVTDLVDKPFKHVHDRLYHLIDKAFGTWQDPLKRLFGMLSDIRIEPGNVFRSRGDAATSMRAVTHLLPALRQSEAATLVAYLEAVVGNGAVETPAVMTWAMIHEMREAGFTIGSHTKKHVSLPVEAPDVIADELAGSKRELEAHLDAPVHHFAYPCGEFTPEVVDAIDRAGYRFGYTTCPHRDARHPLLTIERLLLWENSSTDADGEFSSAVLNCQVHDLWPPARRCERLHS